MVMSSSHLIFGLPLEHSMCQMSSPRFWSVRVVVCLNRVFIAFRGLL
jgi:hypothetical protein